MKKLFLVFKDGSKVTYTMKKDNIDHNKYFNRHSKNAMKSAVLQKYPKKDNEPINLLNNESEEN